MVMKSSTFSEATRPTVPGNDLSLFIAKARETTQEQGTIKSLVFNDSLPQHMGTSYNSPKFGAFTAENLTEGEDITNFQQLSSSNVVVVPGEVGLAFKFSKKSLAQWSDNMKARGGRIARDAKDRKIDADLGGLAASFTTYTLGSAGVILTPGILGAGKSRLKGGSNTLDSAIAAGAVSNQAPAGPINGVFRWESLFPVMRALVGGPFKASAITVAETTVGITGGMQQDIAENLYVDKVAGVHLYGNSNIAKNSDNDAVGMIFHRDAIVYVPFAHDGAEGTVYQRESDDGRSMQLSLVTDYGFGILDQNYGIAVTVDAIPPTA